MLTGRDLIADIDAYQPRRGEFALWWLGQHGFVLKLGRTVFYIDAYLTPDPRRLVPPLLRPEEVANADFILGTHDHGDHIDRPAWPALAAASPNAKFMVPLLLRSRLCSELGLPPARVIGLDDQRTFSRGNLRLTGIAAAHEELAPDPANGCHPALGYVIAAGSATIYHAGDCCVYAELSTQLRRWDLDLMILPINGRDDVRRAAGIIGNMDAYEAAGLAGVVAPGCVVPSHYDMFADNPGDPQLFAGHLRERHPEQKFVLPEHGTRIVLACGGQR
ncbi:MAG: MBL fold metallo-hydrolase [Planctomycetota bacterium]